MKNVWAALVGFGLMASTSAQAVTLSPVMVCHETIHSAFASTSVQIDKERLPLIQGEVAAVSVQATLSQNSLSQGSHVLGHYSVQVEQPTNVDAPAVYAALKGGFKLTVDVHGQPTLGGLIQATLEYSDEAGSSQIQAMVCQVPSIVQ